MESDRKTGGETLCVPDADWTVSKQEIQQQLLKRPCSGNHVPGGGDVHARVCACVRACVYHRQPSSSFSSSSSSVIPVCALRGH